MSLTGLPETADKVATQIVPQVTGALTGLEQSIAADISTATQAVKDSVTGVTTSLNKAVEEITAAVADAVSDLVGAIERIETGGITITIKVEFGQKIVAIPPDLEAPK